MYVDNIRFLDADGKAIDVDLKTVTAPVQTEAETEAVTEAETEEETVVETEEKTETAVEETAAPAEEETASEETAKTEPESDNETTSSTTGNFSAFAAATAVVLSGYAVAMTRKKK